MKDAILVASIFCSYFVESEANLQNLSRPLSTVGRQPLPYRVMEVINGNSETIRNGVVGTTRFTLSSDLKYSFLAA